jgi:hypothetical protein
MSYFILVTTPIWLISLAAVAHIVTARFLSSIHHVYHGTAIFDFIYIANYICIASTGILVMCWFMLVFYGVRYPVQAQKFVEFMNKFMITNLPNDRSNEK